jgi:hypothetical protein
MNRFSKSEISTHRLSVALTRRLKAIPHWLSWYMNSPLASKSKKKLLSYKDIHRGERCFVLANGPSLGRLNFSPLVDEHTFGMNRIYLLFDRMGFMPNYYACTTELVLEQFSPEIQNLSMPKFLNWNRRHLFSTNNNNITFVNILFNINDFFSRNPLSALSGGGTVTYITLQLALYLGFSQVILVGLDHNFSAKGTPNTSEVRTQNTDNDHFDPNYFPQGVRWQLPDLRRSEIAYQMALEAYRADGREIIDATVDGKCSVFPKVKYEDLF